MSGSQFVYATSIPSVRSIRWLAITLLIPGCAMFEATWRSVHYSASLDEDRTIVLFEDGKKSLWTDSPKHNFSTLQLAVMHDGVPFLERAVAHHSAHAWNKVRKFPLDSLEGRADPERNRVWIMNRKTGQVVTSYDFESDALTGPDDQPPEWASADTGDVLRTKSWP